MDDKSVKIITFSGKKADWKFWSKKFCSYVHIKGGEPVWDAKAEDIPKDSEVIDISNDDVTSIPVPDFRLRRLHHKNHPIDSFNNK